MGMLKVFVGIVSLLATILPSFAVAELWNDRRYICLTSQAAGWKNDRQYLELTKPQTQYIIEPKAMVVKAANEAKEGYFEVPISHSVKQVGSTETIALCVDATASSLNCFLWHSEVRGDLKNAIITRIEEFTMNDGREVADPISMTRINRRSVFHPTLSAGAPFLEIGECEQF